MNKIGRIDRPAFILPAVLSLIIVSIGLVAPETFAKLVNTGFGFVTTYFSWFLSLGSTFLVIVCVYLAFSKHGDVVLGGKDAKPEMSLGTWFAITFTTGMGMGIVFYSVGEPLMNYMTPPTFTGIEGGTLQAAEEALKYVFVHWGLHPYSLYTATAIGFAVAHWNSKRSFRVSSGLFPLIGEKTETRTGKIINGLAIAATVAAIGTTCGLGILQLSAGIEYIFGIKASPIVMQGGVMGVIAIIYIIAACSGIHKGIKYVSTANMYIFFIIMAWAFLFSNSVFILNNTTTSIGKYTNIAISQILYLEPAVHTGWISSWTMFYLCWWICTAPLVSLFIIKLAKGRTVRQFIMMNLMVPVIFVFIWFGIFGSGAISAQMAGHDIWSDIQTYGFSVSLFAFLKTLPFPKVMQVIGLLAVLFSFVTMAESMTYTMAEMTILAEDSKVDKESPVWIKVFWGLALALTGLSLTLSGGLSAVQMAVITFGLPTLVLLLAIAFASFKFFTNREKYDLTMDEIEKIESESAENRPIRPSV